MESWALLHPRECVKQMRGLVERIPNKGKDENSFLEFIKLVESEYEDLRKNFVSDRERYEDRFVRCLLDKLEDERFFDIMDKDWNVFAFIFVCILEF